MSDDIPINTQLLIWMACKNPTRHIRNDCLENVSYTAIHYGSGAAQRAVDQDAVAAADLAHQTLMLRVFAGLRKLGLIRQAA